MLSSAKTRIWHTGDISQRIEAQKFDPKKIHSEMVNVDLKFL